jgi:hypothetical protein
MLSFDQVSAVVVTDVSCTSSYKCRRALELSIPVVSASYIHDCITQARLLDFDLYVTLGRKRAEQLESGKISGKLLRRTCKTVVGLVIELCYCFTHLRMF